MNYHETEQKMILREAERDILALLVVDPSSEEYEVIYSDEAYRRFENRYRRNNFFTAWAEIGVNLIHEPDRARMLQELSKERLLVALNEDDIFLTRCRFIANDKPIWCQVKASWNPVEAGTIVISIRNIDRELVTRWTTWPNWKSSSGERRFTERPFWRTQQGTWKST